MKDNNQMEHLQEIQLMAYILDGKLFSSAEQEHVDACEACQSRLLSLMQLRGELDIARKSEVAPDTEASYLAFFVQARQGVAEEAPGHLKHLFDKLTQWLIATPVWDSRREVLPAGLRSISTSSYRLLFGATNTEVELMVEPQNGLRRLMGEVMTGSGDEESEPALVQLFSSEGEAIAMEVESDPSGRFQLEEIAPGVYTLIVTPSRKHSVVVYKLELT
jgi:hypothetical protein